MRVQQISAERVKELTRLGGHGDSLWDLQEIEIWPYEQIVYVQPGECDTQTSLAFCEKRAPWSQPDDQTL